MKTYITKVAKTIGNVLGFRKTKQPTPDTVPVVVTAYSQPHVLTMRMAEENMTHGETVLGNISPVRIESFIDAKGEKRVIMYFCPMQELEILKRVEKGDGGCLPGIATVKDLTFPKDSVQGLYNLKNVKVTSNGTLQVHATAETQWELV